MIYEVTIGDRTHRVDLVRAGTGWKCNLDGREFAVDAVPAQNGALSLLLEGRSYEVRQQLEGDETGIVVDRERFKVVVRDPRSLRSRRIREGRGQGMRKIIAPMPGKVVRLLAAPGDEVEAGQAVLVIEAMKMQNELKAPQKGRVAKLYAGEGAAVEAGQILAEIE
jgi:biotin carboxyl carrier protein